MRKLIEALMTGICKQILLMKIKYENKDSKNIKIF